MHQYKRKARTTLILPVELIEEAKDELNAKTKTEAIVLALEAAVRNKRLVRMTRELAGKVDLDLTQKKLRKLRKSRHL
jgi:hypothetical protein